MAESERFSLSEGWMTGIGCLFLFAMIAAAVYLFITCGIRESRSEHLEKEAFETEYGVAGMVKEKRLAYEERFTKGLALGVVLIILGVVPLVVAGCLEAEDWICGILVAVLLLCIAVGVDMIIRVCMVKDSYDTLLQEGDFSRAEKKAKKKTDSLSGVYWCLVTAGYLGWSFWTMRWDFTWIVWPVAGVLFAALSGLAKAFSRNGE